MFYVYGTILGQEGASLNPCFAKKTRFSQILSFRKEAHLAVKKVFLPRGLDLKSITCMVKPRFHRCSLMVKVLCVWYYSWSGGSIFEPMFCKKHDFHKFSVFVRGPSCSQKSLPLERVIPYPTLVWRRLVSIDVHDGRSFMCMVLFLVRREHLWTQVLQKKHDFHKFSVFVKRQISWSKNVFLLRGLYLVQHLYGEA